MPKNAVFVRGVGSHNGGAEILLRAASDQITNDSTRVVADARKVSKDLRERWDIGGYFSVPKWGTFESAGLDLLPRSLAQRIDVYSGRHISAVLDASGFAVGDQWSSDSINRDAATFARLRARGMPIILLPQAFGPFKRAEVAKAAKQLFSHVDLICARDKESFDHVVELRGSDDRVMLAPDITIALEAHDVPPSEPKSGGRVAIVPNINLTARSDDADSMKRYSSSLLRMQQILRKEGFDPFFLLHSAHGDPTVVAAVSAMDSSIEVIKPGDGLEAKAIIGRCDGIIAGRYHAIVSALSQGVPAVAHSWSHKYGALLNDFGTTRGLADPMDAEQSTSDLIDLMVDESYRKAIVGAKPALVRSVETVWEKTHALIANSVA